MRQATTRLSIDTERQELLDTTPRITEWAHAQAIEGRLALGTWQGIYLFEHRRRPHRRMLHLIGESAG